MSTPNPSQTYITHKLLSLESIPSNIYSSLKQVNNSTKLQTKHKLNLHKLSQIRMKSTQVLGQSEKTLSTETKDTSDSKLILTQVNTGRKSQTAVFLGRNSNIGPDIWTWPSNG